MADKLNAAFHPGDGFHEIGKVGRLMTLPDDGPTYSWGGKTVRTLQERQEVTIPFTFGNPLRRPAKRTAAERMRDRNRLDPYAAVWHLIFGVDIRPARPTIREALVDVWDALRALVLVVVAVVGERVPPKLRTFGTRAADVLWWSWVDPLLDGAEWLWAAAKRAGWALRDGVVDRWDILRWWQWRRLPGPVVRLWTAEMVYVATMPAGRESWASWRRRQARLPLAVWRG
ncbi:hypothetical protein SEA_AMGINE_86 [Mycobacterium phage Amgine]|uniref:Uncharacterized protein n=1 Tax=Mycobacterium phage Amgine TaxID=2015817 RepID=A0A222ZLU1_9CAUD|nr:hypothetical protein I5G84_gp86 [Mycobacterium phage Amgine]ASR85686.1 hypothetical protein SEA_AMGINE_86 [Mycobacterium phage Amgine]